MVTTTTSICVRYKYHAQGWYVFEADELPGLYVASRDAKKAFDDVAPAIKMLLKLNEGIDCTIVPALSFDDFIATVKGQRPDATPHACFIEWSVQGTRRRQCTS